MELGYHNRRKSCGRLVKGFLEKRESRCPSPFEQWIARCHEYSSDLDPEDPLRRRLKAVCASPAALQSLIALFGTLEFLEWVSGANDLDWCRSNAESDGQQSVYLAATFGQVGVIDMLIGKDSTLCDVKDNRGWTPLFYAAMQGQVAAVEQLCACGADIECKEKIVCNTPRLVAAESGQDEVCRYLLDRGATIEKSDKYGQSPLQIAARAGHSSTLRLLQEYGADLESVDNCGCSPLMRAAYEGQSKTLEYLMDQNVCMPWLACERMKARGLPYRQAASRTKRQIQAPK